MARVILRPAGQLRRLPRVMNLDASAVTLSPRAQQRPVAVSSGKFFRVLSPPQEALVTPLLGREVVRVLETFAQNAGFDETNPLPVHFGHGFMGLHRFHRAADIYAVGGKGLGRWMQEWNAAMRKAAASEPQARVPLVDQEKVRNLGYQLYKALQHHGKWAQPPGYPVQLFGPWTRLEGPHQAISDRMLYMHRDHIHMAK